MPTKSARADGRSTKRMKLDAASSNAYHYSDGTDIERRLQVQTQDGLSAGEFSSTHFKYRLPTVPFRSTHSASQPAYSQSWRRINSAARRAVDSRAQLVGSLSWYSEHLHYLGKDHGGMLSSLMHLYHLVLTCSSDKCLLSRCWSPYYRPS